MEFLPYPWSPLEKREIACFNFWKEEMRKKNYTQA